MGWIFTYINYRGNYEKSPKYAIMDCNRRAKRNGLTLLYESWYVE